MAIAMEKPVFFPVLLLLPPLLMAFLLVQPSNQLDLPQSQSLLRIQQYLNFPSALDSLRNDNTDFCNIEPTSFFTVVCYENDITQLHIIGNNDFPPLSRDFSMHSFFTALAKLTTLKVLSLVSLGLWGPLPGSIGHLSSLEILNVSSNYIHGAIPTQLLHLRNLQTIVLDHNNFSGPVPFWLNSLPMLTVLSLKHNLLTGSLPNSLGTLRNLRVLTLSENNFSGSIPDFRKLTNLQILDLEDNQFGPYFPYLPRKLVTLKLRKNRFRLGISANITSFYLLQKLDISMNRFVGPFIPSLLSLPSISYLDISENKFTGVLSENMTCSSGLAFVNLSSNYLVGKLPSCLILPPENGVVLYSGNCLLNDHGHDNDLEQQQHPVEFCHKEALAVAVIPRREKPKTPNNKPVLAPTLACGIVGAIAAVGVVSILVKKKYGKYTPKKPSTTLITERVSTVNTAQLLSNAKHISETMKLGASLPAYRTFSLEELMEATNNFDPSTLMGESPNGQMYRGKLCDGTLVTIRSLEMKKRRSPQAYTHDLEMISKLRHCHLTSALGHCLECQLDDSGVSRVFLVFEFSPNGTLRDCISATQGQKLNWTQRIAAAIGVAKGVQFLHTGIVPGVYSNNLKITNVMLDHNLHVKIGSYNLPLVAENRGMVGNVVSSTTKGSAQDRVKHEDKNDVFDIGIILLEIILGRPVMFYDEVGSLKDLMRVSITTDDTGRRSITDPAVHKQCSNESLMTMMEICVRCLSSEPAERPSIEDILWTLQFAAQVQNSGRGDSMNSHESLGALS
ncbi:probable inactive leucine-rich repeat receptor-like protein kinase At3g03770 [Humulus lupulus]|uniref:probable inactive leucine-rich repeat receptor-like protein kinase At3g03770 n=1 Tax=Humulus lupulus TaxID=3486 RepID=UPI002B40FD91|nr:probable inactive leucine-rich repeat receptor-like protein kinase At3g03770 [Humulus lupulus]